MEINLRNVSLGKTLALLLYWCHAVEEKLYKKDGTD